MYFNRIVNVEHLKDIEDEDGYHRKHEGEVVVRTFACFNSRVYPQQIQEVRDGDVEIVFKGELCLLVVNEPEQLQEHYSHQNPCVRVRDVTLLH